MQLLVFSCVQLLQHQFLKTDFFLLIVHFLLCLRSVYCTFCSSQVSYIVSWSYSLKVAKDDLEFLIFLPLLTKHWNYRYAKTWTVLYNIGDQIQGFLHTKNVFYQLSYIPILLLSPIHLFCHQHHTSFTGDYSEG